jgi:hypothetical protein
MPTHHQPELFPDESPRTLAEVTALLNEGGSLPVAVTLTRNRVSMVSIEFVDDSARVRMHESFLSAPPNVLKAVRTYIRTRRRAAWQTITSYVHSRSHEHDESATVRLRARGAVYDLKALFDEVNAEFFNGRVQGRIGWGRRAPRKRKVRSIRYGSWHPATRAIRVHPALDSTRVPREFVRYIVFHEMLHAVVPPECRAQRWYHHSATFRALERSYPDLPRMRRLSKSLAAHL